MGKFVCMFGVYAPIEYGEKACWKRKTTRWLKYNVQLVYIILDWFEMGVIHEHTCWDRSRICLQVTIDEGSRTVGRRSISAVNHEVSMHDGTFHDKRGAGS